MMRRLGGLTEPWIASIIGPSGARFPSARERVECLFMLYERLQAPLAAKKGGAVKRLHDGGDG